MGTGNTWGILVAAQQMAGVTLPYNAPDLGSEPLFYIDMTSTAPGVNMGTRRLEKDVFDSSYWQAKQVSAVIMAWIPYFSNCEGYDAHMILYDVFERGQGCELPAYEDIRVVNPVPTSGLDPVADRCAPTTEFPEVICRYDEPFGQPSIGSSRWFELEEPRALFYITREPIPIEQFVLQSPEGANP
jgi:hypothetical protein